MDGFESCSALRWTRSDAALTQNWMTNISELSIFHFGKLCRVEGLHAKRNRRAVVEA